MIPVVAGGFSLLGAAYKLGKIMNGIEETNKKVNVILKIKEDFQKLKHNQMLCLGGKLKNSPYNFRKE